MKQTDAPPSTSSSLIVDHIHPNPDDESMYMKRVPPSPSHQLGTRTSILFTQMTNTLFKFNLSR